MSHANQERLWNLPTNELEDAMDRTTRYAAWRLKGCYWQGVSGEHGGQPPGAKKAVDFARDSLEALINGAKWDENKPLWLVLKGIVSGKINHLAVSPENRSLLDSADNEARIQSAQAKADVEAATIQSSIDELPGEGTSEDNLLELTESLDDDPDAKRVVEAIWEGAVKRGEIAKLTGFTVDQVTNIRKRLQRHLKDFRGNFAQKSGI